MLLKDRPLGKTLVTALIAMFAQIQTIPAAGEERVVTPPADGQANQRPGIIIAAMAGNGGIKPGSIMVISENGMQTSTMADWTARSASPTMSAGGFCLVR